ncbi:hypothetical protein VCHC55C2_1644A, partial [Vibrio cholerae HC-55C2]
MSVVE